MEVKPVDVIANEIVAVTITPFDAHNNQISPSGRSTIVDDFFAL